MRTLQEKYNAVIEGNYSKAQFVRDARMSQPQFITQYNGYDDAVQILKNKGMIAEAKAQEPKYSTARPEDTIAPDVLDTGIKFELDKKYGTLDVTDEQYAKCREMAIKNLANDVLYYVKQDSIQLETPGEKMEKVKLNENTFDPRLEKGNEVIKAEPEQKLKELSKEETGPTGIALSQKQMDQLHDKGAVMVQVTVKDSDGKIRTVDYPLSYLGYEKGIDDTEDSELEEDKKQAYDDGVTQDSIDMAMTQAGMKEQAIENPKGVTLIKDRTGNPYTGEPFNGKAFVAYVKNDQANALPARGSEDGGHENLQAALDSLTRSRILHKHSESGKYEPTDAAMEVYIIPKEETKKLFPGLDFEPKEGPSHSIDLNEQQLKELFKKIITKIITE